MIHNIQIKIQIQTTFITLNLNSFVGF